MIDHSLRSLLTLLALTGSLGRLAAARPAPAPQGSKERVELLIRQADKLPLDKAWGMLKDFESLLDRQEAAEDTLLVALQDAADAAGPVGRLVAARGLLTLGEEGLYGKKAVDLVLPILAKGSDDERRAAAHLLGEPNLQGKARRSAADALEALVKDDTQDAGLRLVAARSLYRIANATQLTLSRKVLLGYLGSSDRGLRVQGALAIYEIGDSFHASARSILEQIENEPSAEGRLAHAYLENSRRQGEMERLQRELSRLALREGGTDTGGDRSDELGLLREILNKVRAAHVEGGDLKQDELMERAARGLLRALDPFSSYLTSEQYRRFAFDLNRHYGGIGAYVRMDDNGAFQITRPIYSGPAYRAGLLSGDHILKVDDWETTDQELDDIIGRLKGKPDSDVKLAVWRPGWPETKDIVLRRAEIQVPSVNDQLLPGGIGFVELVTFGADTAEELRVRLEDLRKSQAKAVIMDLRANTGGYLRAAQAVAELFLPKDKLICYTKGRVGQPENHFSRGEPVYADLPLVVLVDGATASAAEIVSGALQDHKRATVVGTQTFGKGSVQHLFPLDARPGEPFQDEDKNGRWDEWEAYRDLNKNGHFDPGAHARITIAYYYLPSGRCVHKIVDDDGKVKNPDYGVLPDVVAELPKIERKELWKNAFIFELRQKNVFRDYVEKHFKGNEELFLKLANGDDGKTDAYPQFDEFFQSLETPLSKDDIRRWTRVAIRERVADLRAKAWPGFGTIGDYQEDTQLQAAIRVALERTGQRVEAIAEYKDVIKTPEAAQPVKTSKK